MNQVNFFFFCVKRIYILTSISICVKQDKTSIPSCIIQMIYLFLRENTYHILDSTSTPSHSPHQTNLENIYSKSGFLSLVQGPILFLLGKKHFNQATQSTNNFLSYLLSIALLCEICKGKKIQGDQDTLFQTVVNT